MLEAKIIVDLICGALFSWGGFSWHNARRFIMPCVIAVMVYFTTHIWWTALMILPVMGTLCLGYKNFGDGSFSRGCWLFVQAVVIGIGLLLTHHLAWYIYIPYIIVAGVLGGTLYNLNQVIGDIIFGCWLGIIVLFVR